MSETAQQQRGAHAAQGVALRGRETSGSWDFVFLPIPEQRILREKQGQRCLVRTQPPTPVEIPSSSERLRLARSAQLVAGGGDTVVPAFSMGDSTQVTE